MFALCINNIKNAFIGRTDEHYYKSVEKLKQLKITTFAPTCFDSRRNHPQGAVLYLVERRKKLPSLHHERTPAQQADMPPYH
jgi:hypothetical protein